MLILHVVATAHLHVEGTREGIAKLSRHGTCEEVAVGQYRAVERGKDTATGFGDFGEVIGVVHLHTLHTPLQHLRRVAVNADTVGGTTCRHTGKHRCRTGRVGHTTSIACGFLHTKHAGTYLCHLVEGHLLVHSGFDHHLAKFRDILAHAQVEHQLLSRREELFLEHHWLVADKSGSDGVSSHGYIFYHKVTVGIRHCAHRNPILYCNRNTSHRFSGSDIANLSANGLYGLCMLSYLSRLCC